ncbi:roadblock/LC7 domain-containing protein [Streptomyces chryseus]
MQNEGFSTTGNPPSARPAREQLSALLADLVKRTPGMLHALLAAGDGIKLAHTMTVDEADKLAATISPMYALVKGQFAGSEGGVHQIVAEHDAGLLFICSAGGQARNETLVGTLLAVLTTPQADAGQVAFEMGRFVKSLEDHLLVAARRNMIPGQGL